MPVTERLMKPGSFGITFKEDTPYSVRKIFAEGSSVFTTGDFGFLGHLFITPTRLSAGVLSLATLLASARFTGVMRRRLRRGISGSDLLYYFGDENSVGDIVTAHMHFNQNFAGWMADIAHDEPSGYASPYDTGTITNTGTGTLDFDPFLMTRRAALDYVSTYFGGEYRVNPDNTFDAGSAANLFVTTPTAVVLPKGGPIDISLEGLQALSLDMEVDYEDYITSVQIIQSEGTLTDESVVSANTLRAQDLRGGLVGRGKVLDSPSSTDPASSTLGQTLANFGLNPRRAISLAADRYDITGHVAAGDTVYVYDPENFIFDTANQVPYGGRVIYPMKLRVRGITWPLQQGMGVYYRTPALALPVVPEVITDLSDYIAWEAGGSSLEVGAEKRALTPGRDVQPVTARGLMSSRAAVYRSTNQLIANATDTAVIFDATRYDPDDMHDAVTSDTTRGRFVISVAGRHHVGAAVAFDTDGTGFRLVQLLVNGTTVIRSTTKNGLTGVSTRLGVDRDWEFDVGDYIEVIVHQTSGGDLNVLASDGWQADFWIHRIAA